MDSEKLRELVESLESNTEQALQVTIALVEHKRKLDELTEVMKALVEVIARIQVEE